MITPLNNNLNTDAEDKSSLLAYETRGAREAAKFYPDFLQYKDRARIVCNEHTQISQQAKQKKIEGVENDIEQQRQFIETKKQEIQKIESEKNKHQLELAGLSIAPSKAPFFITGSIVIFLGTALFLFYGLTLSSVIGTLVKSATDQMQGQQIQAAIPTLWDNFLKLPIFLKIISILLSVLPLGIGYLLQEYKQKKQWFGFIIIILFVFVLDVVIATVVEKQIYTQESLITEMKPFNQYISDSMFGSFGAIILLGFGAYLVWGMLLDSFLEKLNPQIHKTRVEQKIKSFDLPISILKNEIQNIESLIIEFKNKIKDLIETQIRVLDKEAEKELQKNLSNYTSGWEKYIIIYHGNDKQMTKAKIEELFSKKDEVIKEFYETFETKKQ